MQFRAKPGRFIMAEAVPFGQRWTYYSTDPMDKMMDPEYFKALSSQIRAGDDIRIMRIEDDKVAEIAEVLVVDVDKDGASFHVMLEPVKIGQRKNKPGPKPKLRSLKIEEGKGCWYLLTEDDKVAGEFATEAEAKKHKPELERVA